MNLKRFFEKIRFRMYISSLKRQIRKTERLLKKPEKKHGKSHYILGEHLRFLKVKLESAQEKYLKEYGKRKMAIVVSGAAEICDKSTAGTVDDEKKQEQTPEDKEISKQEFKQMIKEIGEDIRKEEVESRKKSDVVCLIKNRHKKYNPQVRTPKYARTKEFKIIFQGSIKECLQFQKKYPKRIRQSEYESINVM